MTTETETGVTQPQAKGHQGLAATPWSWERGLEQRGQEHCGHLLPLSSLTMGSSWQEGHVMLTPPLCGFSVPCRQLGPAPSRSKQISKCQADGEQGGGLGQQGLRAQPPVQRHIGERGLRTVRQVDRRGAGQRGARGGPAAAPGLPPPLTWVAQSTRGVPELPPLHLVIGELRRETSEDEKEGREGGRGTRSRLNTEKATNQPTSKAFLSAPQKRTQKEKLDSNCRRAECLKKEKRVQACPARRRP